MVFQTGTYPQWEKWIYSLCQFGLETSGSCKGLICKGISGLPPNMARITHSPEDSTAVTSLSIRTIGTSSPGIKFGR
jgi:hypothetical protein